MFPPAVLVNRYWLALTGEPVLSIIGMGLVLLEEVGNVILTCVSLRDPVQVHHVSHFHMLGDPASVTIPAALTFYKISSRSKLRLY